MLIFETHLVHNNAIHNAKSHFIHESRYTYWRLIRITRGNPKKEGTASSISAWDFTKLTVMSGRVLESFTHCPGLGSGTFRGGTGNQFEFIVSCSLKGPSKVSKIFCTVKAHTAEPLIELTGVENTA